MAITFTSGGFDGTIRSDSSGNIFIETQDNTKSVNIGGIIEYTGSLVKTLDKTTQKVIRETERVLDSGKTIERSGSATENQIEFIQKAGAAIINLSASANPRFNIIDTGLSKFRMIRGESDYYYWQSGAGTGFCSTGVDDDMNYWIAPSKGVISDATNINTATKYLMVSQSGDVYCSGKIFANEYHTNFNSSSILFYSGSTRFGDTQDDIHTFTGKLSGSVDEALHIEGNVSASGNFITPNDLDIGGSLQVDENVVFTGATNGLIKYGANEKIDFKPAGAITVTGNISSSGATIHNVNIFGAGDTTPDVSEGTIFKTNNGVVGATTITGFDNGKPGQIIYIIHNDNNTDYADDTNLQLWRGLDHTSAQINDTITFICVNGTRWVEQSRSDNT